MENAEESDVFAGAAVAAAHAVDDAAAAERGNGVGQAAEVMPPPPPQPVAGADADTDDGAEVEGAVAAAAAANREEHNDGEMNGIGVNVAVNGFREAVTVLEDANDRRPIDYLSVHPAARANRNQDQLFFRRFVELLGQLEGGRDVRGIGLNVGWEGLRDVDLELLFRDVLPGHRTIQQISIVINDLPQRFFQMLTESIPAATANSSTLQLYISGVASNPEIKAQTLQAIVDMLNRNAAIEELGFMLGLDPHQCQLICSAVPRNSVLRVLSLNVTEMVAGTLDGVAASSSLRRLAVHGPLTDNGVSSLARQLRTNETLQTLLLLDVVDRGTRVFSALLELVRTYNYTVSNITVHANNEMSTLLEPYLNRNWKIRWALEELQNPDPYQRLVAPTPELVAHFLCRTSGMPTAVFRTMKHWYVHYQAATRLSLPSGRKRKAAATADVAAAIFGGSSHPH